MLRDSQLRFDRLSLITRLATVGTVLLCGLARAETPAEILLHFDHAATFRFDRDTDKVLTVHQVEPYETEFKRRLQAIYIRNPEYSLHWSSRDYHEVVRRRKNADPLDVVAPFDIRCVGLAFNVTLDRGGRFEKIYDGWRTFKTVGS